MTRLDSCPCSGVHLPRFVQPVLLALLVQEPMHGYALRQKMLATGLFAADCPDMTGIYRNLRDMVERMRGMGFIAMYNHPVWSRVSEYEFAGEAGIFALEIFNYDTENESGTGFDTTHWDVMLRAGRRVWGAATDDNHNEGIFDDSCGGWVTVRAPELTHDAIIESLLAGNFYYQRMESGLLRQQVCHQPCLRQKII